MPESITPLIAADAVIELVDRPGRPTVLTEQLNPPHGWAIPGGFVDVGERVETAAVREDRGETGVEYRPQGGICQRMTNPETRSDP